MEAIKKIYKIIPVIFMIGLLIIAGWSKPASQAFAFDGNAAKYYDMGMKTSLAYKKIKYFTIALELNPNFAPAYEERGLNYYFQGKYHKVIEDYTHYVHLVPHKADAYRMLGIAYLKTGSYEKAISTFNKALKLEPNMPKVFSYQAEAYQLSGQPHKAIKEADKAIDHEMDQHILADVYRTRGKAYQALGQEKLANADFNRATQIDPRYWFYRYISGYANLEEMRKAGLIGMIAIAFVFIFSLKLKPPKKDD